MTPSELDAIRARDRDYDDVFEAQAAMPPHIAHRLVAWPVHDRRALLAYVDELRSRLADTQAGAEMLSRQSKAYEARLVETEARHRRVMAVIRPFYAKYAPDLLAEFDAAMEQSQ